MKRFYVLCLVAAATTIGMTSCGLAGISSINRNSATSAHQRKTSKTTAIPSNLSTTTAEGEFYDVYFTSASKGWATLHRASAILQTNDGGKRWAAEPTPMGQSQFPNRQWYGIYFANQSDGWAVGKSVLFLPSGKRPDKGYIIATKNGGRYWSQEKVVPGKELFGISCVGIRDCWAVGQDGVVLATRDGGRHWTYQNSGVLSTLYNVQFVNRHDGWAVGEDETIIATTDGGASWTVQLSGLETKFKNFVGNVATYALINLDFINNKDGWVVGGNKQILYTSDGGKVWTVQLKAKRGQGYGFNAVWHAVNFKNTQDGWVVGWGKYNTYVLYTNNGGHMWHNVSSMERPAAFGGIYDIFFRGSEGWITGPGMDSLYHTSDDGENWQRYRLQFMDCRSREWVLCVASAKGGM